MKFMRFNEDNRRIMTHNFPERLTEQQKEGGYLFEDDQIPERLIEKEGFYQELFIQLPEETLYWDYIEIPPKPKTEIDLFKEEFYNIQVGNEHTISAVRSSTQKVVDTLSSASVMKDFSDIKLAYDKGMIDEEIVLHKVKTACLDLVDYNTITNLNILDTDITLEEAKLAKIASCKRHYNKLIEQGIQSDISGQMLIYEYDERDQQNFADKMNFFASKEITDKGVITQASEFPDINNVNIGDKYTINGVGIIDNDVTKTNTGLMFLDSQEIFWNGVTWTEESYFNATDWIGVGLLDDNLKVPVTLTENQFKKLYAKIGINKENYIVLCGIKINEINNSASISEVFDITFEDNNEIKISSLSISGYSDAGLLTEFDSNVYDYEATDVQPFTTSVIVTAIKSNPLSKLYVNGTLSQSGDPVAVNIESGTNVITISVSLNGSTVDYTITVNK